MCRFRGIRCKGATALYPDRQPVLHLTLEPSNSADANLNSAGKVLISLQLIDHRTRQTGYLADFWQTKYLKPIDWSDYRCGHKGPLRNVRFPPFGDELSLEANYSSK